MALRWHDARSSAPVRVVVGQRIRRRHAEIPVDKCTTVTPKSATNAASLTAWHPARGHQVRARGATSTSSTSGMRPARSQSVPVIARGVNPAGRPVFLSPVQHAIHGCLVVHHVSLVCMWPRINIHQLPRSSRVQGHCPRLREVEVVDSAARVLPGQIFPIPGWSAMMVVASVFQRHQGAAVGGKHRMGVRSMSAVAEPSSQ